MTIYNITTQVSWSVHDEWKRWLFEEHIPRILSTGLFSHFQAVKLLEADEEFGPTYAVQLYVREGCSIEEYRQHHLEEILESETKSWGERAFSFSSLMEVIN